MLRPFKFTERREFLDVAKGKYKEWLTEDGLLKLKAWSRDGLTNEDIANNIGITTSTLYLWKNKYSEFSDALKKGKEVADIIVENALYKRAVGYVAEDTKIKIESGEETERIITKKDVPPDVTAIIYWLKNRKPDKWKDKPIQAPDSSENDIVKKLTEVFGFAE